MNIEYESSLANSDFIKGLGFGFAKISFVQPLWTIKTRMQQGQTFSLRPSILFKGIGMNVAGYPMATATQVSTYKYMQNSINHEDNGAKKLSIGFFAGVPSGAIICLNDFIMTQHSLRRTSYKDTIINLSRAYKFNQFFTGLCITSLREGGYATCFLVVPDLIKPYISSDIQHKKIQELVASLGAGVLSTLITQPADTIKSVQQTAVIGFNDAVKNIYNKNGAIGFFKGYSPRCMQVTAGIMLLDQLKQSFLPEVENKLSNN